MSFTDHDGVGETFLATPTAIASNIWTEDHMRRELQARGVWPSSVSGNVENWYPQVLAYVRSGTFTFEQFANEFAEHQPFDFGVTLSRLISPPGWYDEAMS